MRVFCRGRGWGHACVHVCVRGWVRMHERGRVLAYPICHAPFYLRLLWIHPIFRHYLINGTTFGKKSLNIKRVFLFSLRFFFKTFLIQRIIQLHIVRNVKTSSCEVPVTFAWFQWNLNFLNRYSKTSEVPNVIKIRPVGAELFHADTRTNGRTQRS
jgi:hypothetical protein